MGNALSAYEINVRYRHSDSPYDSEVLSLKDWLERELSSVSSTFDGTADLLEAHEERLDDHGGRLDSNESTLDDHEQRIKDLEDEVFGSS